MSEAAETKQAGPTPGPWRVEHRCIGKTEYDDESCGLGLDIVGPPEATNRGQFERSADARLIAAAPDLLEICQAIWCYMPLGINADVDAAFSRCGEVLKRVGEYGPPEWLPSQQVPRPGK